MGEVMKEAAFSLAEAKFATGDFNQVVLQNVTKAQIKIRTKKDNVAGVTLPVFESYTVSKKYISCKFRCLIDIWINFKNRMVRTLMNWLVWLVVVSNWQNWRKTTKLPWNCSLNWLPFRLHSSRWMMLSRLPIGEWTPLNTVIEQLIFLSF